MQAFAYHHLVADKPWMIRITGSVDARPPVRAASEKAEISAAGSTIRWRYSVFARTS